MSQLVLDYSWARPDPASLRSAGAIGVARYLTRDTTGKAIDGPELHALQAAGLPVALVFEDAADRASLGGSAGHADAVFINYAALQLSWPSDRPIYASVDFDITGHASDAQSYLAAFAATSIYPIGIYGGYDTLQLLPTAQSAHYRWQTRAWSNGQTADTICLYQAGPGPITGTDANNALLPDWGQHPAPTITTLAAPGDTHMIVYVIPDQSTGAQPGDGVLAVSGATPVRAVTATEWHYCLVPAGATYRSIDRQAWLQLKATIHP